MVYRLSWLAGAVGVGLALARVDRLLQPTVEGVKWQLAVAVAAIVGAAVTTLMVARGLRGPWVLAGNIVAVGLALLGIAVPHTRWVFLPTAESLEVVGLEVTLVGEVIASGSAPVPALPGLVAIIAVVFWVVGAIVAWGLMSGRPYVAVLVPLVVYVEFSIIDPLPAGRWAVAFVAALGFALLAVAIDQRRLGTGLLVSMNTRRALSRAAPLLGIVTVSAFLVASLVGGRAAAHLVPEDGHADWRSDRGLSGSFFGSIAYNPFVGIRQSLVSLSDTPVFTADVSGDMSPTRLYWRLLTLDAFDGEQWFSTSGDDTTPLEQGLFERSASSFSGPTAQVQAAITIEGLRMDWLPAPYAPVGLSSPSQTVESSVGVRREDASLKLSGLTNRGMAYTVTSDVPRLDPAFSTGLDPDAAGRSLPDAAHFLALPADLDPNIARLAESQVLGWDTDFDRALALESFFRVSGSFAYSTDIEPGHGATDIVEWLFDPESNNYRTGYCEQFATAMAVMARTIGIPSRVVLGFTPGVMNEDGQIVVRDRNAHAWVDLWIPSHGWVRFDPTPRSDGANPSAFDSIMLDVEPYEEMTPDGPDLTLPDEPIVRPEPQPEPDLVTTPDPGSATSEPSEPSWFAGVLRWLPLAAVAALVIGGVPFAKWLRRRKRVRQLEDGEVAAAWQEIVDQLTDLGWNIETGATPAEIARSTAADLVPLAAAHGEASYGPGDAMSPERLAVAVSSFETTRGRLRRGFPLHRRVRAQYRLRSLRRPTAAGGPNGSVRYQSPRSERPPRPDGA